jgi:hypothetical protein
VNALLAPTTSPIRRYQKKFTQTLPGVNMRDKKRAQGRLEAPRGKHATQAHLLCAHRYVVCPLEGGMQGKKQKQFQALRDLLGHPHSPRGTGI